MQPDPDLQARIRRFEEQYAGNPDSLVFARLADLHRKAGDPERALEVLREGLRHHPEYASGHLVRGRCLRALGDREEAREAFRRVLELDGRNLVALRSLAELASERGDRPQARRHLRELLEVDPGNESARELLRSLSGTSGAAVSEPPPDAGEPVGSAGSEGPGTGTGGTAAPPDAGETSGGAEVEEESTPWWRSFFPGGGRSGPEREAPAGGASPGEVEAGEGEAEEPAAGRVDETGEGRAEETGAESAGAQADEDEPGEDRSPAFGTADADELRARIQELGRDIGEGDGGADGETDLATETLAGLYHAQGFHREAVEMYEELLERHPDDEELQDRLRRAREALEAAGEEERSVEAPAEPTGPRGRAGSVEEDADDPAATARGQLRALLRGEASPSSRGTERSR